MVMDPNPTDPAVPAPGAKPAPRLRCADRQILVPAMRLEDLLTPDDHARTVWDFVQGLDLTPLLDAIRAVEGGPGRPATLEECPQEAHTQVQRLRAELEADPAEAHRRRHQAQQRAARARAERVRQALQRLPELEAKKKAGEEDQARASTTDPEATVM